MAIRLMVNGLPGGMALEVLARALADPRFAPVPLSLTGPETATATLERGGIAFELAPPGRAGEALDRALAGGPLVAVDYTLPAAAAGNARLYAARGIPFVMGTTGGDAAAIRAAVEAGRAPAVVAPNMAAPVVALQAAAAFLAATFPGMLAGYTLSIRESHQSTKVDTSGTAKAMVEHLNVLGCDFPASRIEKVRDPAAQRAMGVPEGHLAGHAYHTYRLASPDGSVDLALSHDIRGRGVYAAGTLLAVRHVARLAAAGAPPRVHSMADVLAGVRDLG